jgi:uncharacterized RDD family membrane protein YckC
LDVYETVIREKTPGVPNLVYAAPGPDAFWRLQEQLAILRKLNIEDLKRLKESVSLVMQADVVARRGDVLAYIRGAEMYSNAARFNPFNELALMSCGVSLARAGYHGEALPWLARALEVNPGNERVKTNIEAVRADIAKGRDPGSPSGRLLGDLPEAVKSESIPAFNLIWPPAESPRSALQPKTIPAVPRKTEQAPYANILLRFVAYLIDAIVLMIPSMIVLSMISPPAASSQNLDASRGLAVMLLVGWWLYFAIMESSAKGATLGKMLLHLRVTDMKGDRISFARATGRFFAKALGILTFYIGFLMAFFTAKKQALHDLISGCLVVTVKPVRDLTQEDEIHQLRTHGKSEERMRVSRVVYFFCSRCKHVFKKEENLKGWRIALMIPESAPVVFGTLTCQYCGNVMPCGDIYAGQYDVPKQYWPDLPAPHEI